MSELERSREQHPNVQIARRLWNAAADGDANTIAALYAPDVVVRTHGRGPLAGEVKGVRAALENAARAGELVDDLTSELIDIYASDCGAVLHYRITADRGPKRLDGEAFFVMRIENGRIVEADAVPQDQARDDAFWRLD